jgi:hypothetical protein
VKRTAEKFVYDPCEFLNLMANNIAAIRNSIPQTKLESMLTMKIPTAFPIKKAIPTMPFAINSHFIARSDFPEKTGAAHNRAIPIKPYPSAANVQKKE